jgi:hypothetical protein
VFSQSILPSLADDERAAFGHGQYFTDISPGEAAAGSSYQLSRALFSTPWFNWRVTHFVAINVSGLAVDRVSPVYSRTYGDRYIYLYRTEVALPVEGRIVLAGPVPFTGQ